MGAWLFDPRRLARLYETTGAYDKADPLYLESMAIRSEVLGKKHIDYAASLNNLAELYETTGAYESMAIRSHVLGKKHAGYAASLNILAALFVTTDAYDKAEQPYVECMALQSEVLSKRSHLGFQIQRAEVAVKKISMTPTPA